MVKTNLSACFCKIVLFWYNFELIDRKQQLIYISAIFKNSIFLEFAKRFKLNSVIVLNKLNNIIYIFADIWAQQSVQLFIQKIVCLARAADIDNSFNQIIIIWNYFNLYLQQYIPQSTKDNRLSLFLDQLKQKFYI